MDQRTWTVGAAAALACGAASAGPGIFVVPSSQEAVSRGLVYVMQNYPQQLGGLQGFGCGFADLDADGDPDVVLLGRANGQVGIFENNGAGFFTDRSALSNIPTLPEASGFAAADYNGDGLPDLYLTQMGLTSVLARNDGNFHFTNVSAAAGVADAGAGTGPCWGDFNGDSWLDLYVVNYNGAVPNTLSINNKLYRNNGNGTFTDVGVAQGVDDSGFGFQGLWFDYDQDGDVDLYLSNDRGHLPPFFKANRLWRNDNGTLVDVSESSGAGVALYSMGIACGDFDGNGWADLYVTNLPGYEEGFNRLLLNLADGTFLEASASYGVQDWASSWGTIFYDFDNNAYTDLFVNNQFLPNSLFLTSGAPPCNDWSFNANVSGNSGIHYNSAVADVDNDGDLDLLLNSLGPATSPDLNVELFINNTGQMRRWIKYRVVGLGSNREAVGARLNTRTGTRWQLREVLAGGNGYLGQNQLIVHVGLDSATIVDEVAVSWPGGATTRTLVHLPSNNTWSIYPPQRLGDGNGDGVVNLGDFFKFASCYQGGFAPGCEMMDFDGDSAIQFDDFQAFLNIYTGPRHDCDGNGVTDLQDILLAPGLDADNTGIPDACETGGDLNGDGSVGTIDFLMLLEAWGPCPSQPAPCPADIDNNGSVGTIDFLALLGNWG